MPVDRQRLKERAFERRWARAGKDLCDLFEAGLVSDGQSGHTLDTDPIAANVQCIYEEVSGGAAQVNFGGITVIASHRLEMKRTPQSLALTPHGNIRVHPREGNLEMVFEQPIRTEGSASLLAEFKAILMKAGYRQPGVT